jgi:hypothetical protein
MTLGLLLNRGTANAANAKNPAGIQIQVSSLSKTAKPRSLKNLVIEIGETRIGRQGRK